MEEAYLAALDKVGGLEAAKPRAILDELQHEFPHLTLQASGRTWQAGPEGQAGDGGWVTGALSLCMSAEGVHPPGSAR